MLPITMYALIENESAVHEALVLNFATTICGNTKAQIKTNIKKNTGIWSRKLISTILLPNAYSIGKSIKNTRLPKKKAYIKNIGKRNADIDLLPAILINCCVLPYNLV